MNLLLLILSMLFQAQPLRLVVDEVQPLEGRHLQQSAAGGWEDMRGQVPVFPRFSAPQDLRLRIQVPEAGRWWLVSVRPLSRLEVEVAGRRTGPVGFLQPGGNGRRNLTMLPLDLPVGESKVHLRVANPLGTLILGLVLVPEELMPDWVQERALVDAAELGAIAVILLWALFLWLGRRDRAVGWYALYVLCCFLWIALMRDRLFPRLPDGLDFLARLSPRALSFAAMICFGVFMDRLLRLSWHHPRLGMVYRWVLRSMAGIVVLSLLVLVAPGFYVQLFSRIPGVDLPMAAYLALLLVLLGLRVRAGDVLARRLLLSSAPLLAAMVFGFFTSQFWGMDVGDRKMRLIMAAGLVENVLVTLVLVLEVQRRERERQELQRGFDARLIGQMDGFRREVALELHDDLCQRMVAVRMGVHQLEREYSPQRCAAIQVWAGELLESIRGLAHRLHPPELAADGFLASLQELCLAVGEGGGCKVELDVEGNVDRLDGIRVLHVYRLVQEALSNAVRHGKARHVDVGLKVCRSRLELEIRDDGCGCEVEQVRPGLGLQSMNTRVRALGGECLLRSRLGEGVRIRVWVPLEEG